MPPKINPKIKYIFIFLSLEYISMLNLEKKFLNLFFDSSVNKELYSIIEQGKDSYESYLLDNPFNCKVIFNKLLFIFFKAISEFCIFL